MVPELCFGFIFLIITLQNSTTAQQHEPVGGSQGTKLDATLDKYKHTQQGTAWRSLCKSIASLSPKTLTSSELNSQSFSVTIIRASFTHLSANLPSSPTNCSIPQQSLISGSEDQHKALPWAWAVSPWSLGRRQHDNDLTGVPPRRLHTSVTLLTHSTLRGALPHQGRFLGAGSCSWLTILKQQLFLFH